MGAVVDESLVEEIRVTVIATGFEKNRRIVASSRRRCPRRPPARAGGAGGGRTVDLTATGAERPAMWRRPRVEGVRRTGAMPTPTTWTSRRSCAARPTDGGWEDGPRW